MFERIDQDALNRSAWTLRASQRWLDAVGPFTDEGERAALDLVRETARGKPILDLGVGTGRTVPLLHGLTDAYRAIDYVPAMVDACRARHPGVRVDVGDARSLEGVASGHVGLVSFSFNGLDAVDHDGRRRALTEMRRVVRDDGVVSFSTLNLAGPAFRERPWHLRIAATRHPARLAMRAVRAVSTMPLDLAGWLRLRSSCLDAPGWAIAPLSAHHYGVLAHFTTLARQLEELEEVGLDRDVIVLDNKHGARITTRDDTSRVAWFHVVARPR